MNKTQLRKFAIDLLDDEHGINEAAWVQLYDALHAHDCADIIAAVDSQDNRWFLGETAAAELRAIQ